MKTNFLDAICFFQRNRLMKKGSINVGSDRVLKGFEAILRPFADRDGLEAMNFASLRLKDGRPLFVATVKSAGEMYDLGCMMHHFQKQGGENPVRRVYTYLESVVIPTLNEMIEDGKEEHFSIITFMSPLLEEERERENAVIALNENKGPLTDASSCKRCGALQVHRRIAQTRSADEGFSSIFICPQCSFSWVEN